VGAPHPRGRFCLLFLEKTKPLPFSAFSAFSAVQSAVSDNGEDFTAEGAEGAADVSAFCFVEKTKPLPFSAFSALSAVQSGVEWCSAPTRRLGPVAAFWVDVVSGSMVIL